MSQITIHTTTGRTLLAIARNAADDGGRSASFIDPIERKRVARLAAAGLLEITSRGTWRGCREVHARITDAGRAALDG